jgi:hypothetical protein
LSDVNGSDFEVEKMGAIIEISLLWPATPQAISRALGDDLDARAHFFDFNKNLIFFHKHE